MKIEINGWMHVQKNFYGKPAYKFFPYEDMSGSGYVNVCPHTIVFELPKGFDPTAGFISALEKRKAELHREFAEKVARINEEISKLQAITYEAPEIA